jgi:GT2 family glycosyltransferase
MLAFLAYLKLRQGDEVIVADNTDDGVAAAFAGPLRVVTAGAERSSYHARNAGARAARNGWLLFMDADCLPSPGLLDAYFIRQPGDRCGAVAGQIQGEASQRSLAARYARSRRLFAHVDGLIRASDGHAATGNLLVRRDAFDEVGGFAEGIRSAGDVDLCRRLRVAGWEIDFRAGALVHHRHRESLPSLLRAIARYGAGSRWLHQRYPGTSPRWPLGAGLAGVVRDLASLARRGRLEAAAFRGLDGVGLVAHNLGYLAGANEARRQGPVTNWWSRP